jgi:hypothetical protein
MNDPVLQAAFESLLADVGASYSKIPEKSVSLLSGQRGSAYTGELMVVGRAVNGYEPSFDPATWSSDAAKKRDLDLMFKRDGEDPLKWVSDMWVERRNAEGKRLYSTGRSAFWRVIRQSLPRLSNTDDVTDWSVHLVWTNLYKVAPVETGNPSVKLCRAQQSGAENVLRGEIETYAPHRVLFLTGSNWFDPFAVPLGFTDLSKPTGKLVQRIGTIPARGGLAKAVVATHPQGKPESLYVNEVSEAFALLDASSLTSSARRE